MNMNVDVFLFYRGEMGEWEELVDGQIVGWICWG